MALNLNVKIRCSFVLDYFTTARQTALEDSDIGNILVSALHGVADAIVGGYIHSGS